MAVKVRCNVTAVEVTEVAACGPMEVGVPGFSDIGLRPQAIFRER